MIFWGGFEEIFGFLCKSIIYFVVFIRSGVVPKILQDVWRKKLEKVLDHDWKKDY